MTSSDTDDTVRSRRSGRVAHHLARSVMRSALNGLAYAAGSNIVGLLIWWLQSH